MTMDALTFASYDGAKLGSFETLLRAECGAIRALGSVLSGAGPGGICLLPGAARWYAFGTISPSSVRSRARTAGEHARTRSDGLDKIGLDGQTLAPGSCRDRNK